MHAGCMRIQTRYAVLPACGLIVGALMGVSLHFDNIDGKKFEEALFMQVPPCIAGNRALGPASKNQTQGPWSSHRRFG